MYNDDDGDWVGDDYLDALFILGALIMIIAFTIAAWVLWKSM